MSALADLLTKHTEAQTAYDELVKPLLEEKRDATPEEEEKRTALAADITQLLDRIDEESAKETRSQKLIEARRLVGIGTPEARVTHEPKTYGERNSPNSYFGDLTRASSPLWPDHDGAIERLGRHSYEMAREAHLDTPEGRSAVLQVRELASREARGAKDMAEKRLLDAGNVEFRTPLSTGGGATLSSSGGSGAAMVIPPALTSDWVPYRQAGRTFADTIHKEDLPDSGMTVYIPNVTGASSIAAQTENSALSETSPSLGFLSGAVVTEAGQVEVSQQLLDRAGPGIQFDRVIADSLRRALAPLVDTYCLTQALSGAGTIVDNTNSWAIIKASGTGGLYGKLSNAKQTIRTAAGTFANPTAVFMSPARWELIAGYADANGRPLVVPDRNGPYNAVATAAGDGNAGVDTLGSYGRTGYQINTLDVFQDYNIPAPASGNDQVVILDPDLVWLFEGTPVPRVIPQTKANQLTVYIQLYEYLTAISIYPLAVQASSGTFYATPVYA